MFGVGPVIAATILGEVPDITRFPSRDHFAAYNGTAPVEASSGKRTVFRLSRRGNRRLNHAIHMAAVTQVRNKHSDGRAYFDKKTGRARPARKHSARSNEGSATPSTLSSRPTACHASGPGRAKRHHPTASCPRPVGLARPCPRAKGNWSRRADCVRTSKEDKSSKAEYGSSKGEHGG